MSICRHTALCLLSTVSLYTLVSLCHGCPRGSFWNADTSQCTPCAPGTYQFATNASSCIPCEAGRYHTITGAQSQLVCRFCPAGTFSATGSSSCTPCPEGSYSSERSSHCVTCPKGTFVATSWINMYTLLIEDGCQECYAGYADEENLLECKSCPPGHAAPPGSTSIEQCSPCPAGTYSEGYDQCHECEAGTFSGRAAGKCTLCQAGSMGEKDFGSTSCIPCQPGQYGRRTSWYLSGTNAACFDCPENTTSYTPGRRFCRRIDGPCPRGYIQTSSGDCERCETDQRYDLELERCVPCDRTEGSVGGLPLQCAPCADVLKAGVEKSHCVPSDLYSPIDIDFLSQTCAPGTYIHDTEFARFCLPCEPGFFSSEANSFECTRCPDGTASSYYGSEHCQPCPQGMIPNEPFTDCVDRQTGCTADTKLALLYQGNIRCIPKECSVGNDGSESCPPCTGSDLSSFGFEGCEPCPGNQVRVTESVCGCGGALAQNLGVIDGTCSECPAGSYGTPNAVESDNVCVQCPSGTYREVATRERILSSLCPRCTASPPCKKCPVGFVARNDGSTECEQCPPGTFSYGAGDTECLLFGDLSASVPFNDPLDLNVKRELERFPEWWEVFQTE